MPTVKVNIPFTLFDDYLAHQGDEIDILEACLEEDITDTYLSEDRTVEDVLQEAIQYYLEGKKVFANKDPLKTFSKAEAALKPYLVKVNEYEELQLELTQEQLDYLNQVEDISLFVSYIAHMYFPILKKKFKDLLKKLPPAIREDWEFDATSIIEQSLMPDDMLAEAPPGYWKLLL
jgi:hypothetical protein